ncbi:MAG: T9SS type A sorting domain-containing protein [Ignavibacteria bacterium]
MKKFILTLLFLLGMNNVNSQITNDYPFKTFLDSANNLYVAGSLYNIGTQTFDISYEKFNSVGERLEFKFFNNPSGYDRGLDLSVDNAGNIFISGYIFNSVTKSNDIIVLKYNALGNLAWSKIYNNPGDDKGYGIDIINDIHGNASEIYISGYITNTNSQPAFFVQRLNGNGNEMWTQIISTSGKYDISTDLKVDAGHVYAVGYSFQGHYYGDDIMIVTIDKESGTYAQSDVLIHNIAGYNEKPTAFSLVDYSRVPISKSRSVVTSISESFQLNPVVQTRFFTIFYDEDSNQKLNVKWTRQYANSFDNRFNAPTALAVDSRKNVYVTGYTMGERAGEDLNFVTMVYTPERGRLGWNGKIEYYNNESLPSSKYDDKASSIKLSSNGNVYVAGTSDASPYGYSVINYEQDTLGNPPTKKWVKTFQPLFESENGISESQSQKTALLEVDSEGQPILIAMEWNGNNAQWKARKYDTEGNVIFTIGQEENLDQISEINLKSNLKNSDNDISKTQLLQNKPNPFNPSTEIFYNVAQNGFVNIKVYNLLGQEVAALVNEMKQPGNYQIRFDGSALSSGMYFYKMFVNENLIDGKRMLLLK